VIDFSVSCWLLMLYESPKKFPLEDFESSASFNTFVFEFIIAYEKSQNQILMKLCPNRAQIRTG